MRSIDWLLNTLAIIILLGGAIWIMYLLVYLSIVVNTTLTDVGVLVAVVAFVLWRLHKMWGEDKKYYRCSNHPDEKME